MAKSFAFYVSGHGFGHATRAAALISTLLKAGHKVTIVTNAPPAPFSSVLPPESTSTSTTDSDEGQSYASYRHAKVDAGIVQPLAYSVDRKATVDLLKEFMDCREERLREEVDWMLGEGCEVVLSDSTFLGCAAAAGAGIPSILVTNFTFDSCYSYLSLPIAEGSLEEGPIPAALLQPLVDQARADYSQASLLLRLPGAIPIPAFDLDVPMPASTWINSARTGFVDEIETILNRSGEAVPCNPPPDVKNPRQHIRKVVDAPLIVRPPSQDVCSSAFRTNILNNLGIALSSHSAKILLVSFGGQSIPRPKSRPPSPSSSPTISKYNSTLQSGGFLDSTPREPGLLPAGWIAIVCGLKVDSTASEGLPLGFYRSPLDVYVPDMCAIADVLLGKLGYGSCSEALSVKTPMVYVPRPLFIEEFGLKRMMLQRGTAIELNREDFEAGRWEDKILVAYEKGRFVKEEAKKTGFVDEGAGEILLSEIESFLQEWQG